MSIELLLPAITVGVVGAAIGAAVLGRRDTADTDRHGERDNTKD